MSSSEVEMEENEQQKPRAAVRRVSPAEAKSLLDLGYTYVDVRSVEEFHTTHPKGAINVPLLTPGLKGSPAYAEFLVLMDRLFGPSGKIVIGCATGGRSLFAAETLSGLGFMDLVDQRAGMAGARSAFGALLEPGWTDAGLPVATGPDAGSFVEVKKRLDGAASAKNV